MPEPDKSIGKKILHFFIKEAENPNPVSVPVQPAAPSAAAVPPAPATPLPGQPDAKFAEHLANVLAKNNLPGPDYFEFGETLRSLSHLNLPEDKQYQAAWASFKALGGAENVQTLMNSANQYLNVLNADKEGFQKSVETALNERIGGLQQEQKRLKDENEVLSRQLADIQQKVKANTDRLAGIESDMTDQSARINQNRQSYDQTFQLFVTQIKSDLDKLRQYLS